MANYLLDQTGAEVQAILNAVQAPDTTPVEGSTKLITSGGVQAALAGTAQELNAEVAALGQEVSRIEGEIVNYDFADWTNYTIQNNLSTQSDANYRLSPAIWLPAGAKIEAYTSGPGPLWGIVQCNSDGTITSGLVHLSGNATNNKLYTYTAASDMYVRVSICISVAGYYVKRTITGQLEIIDQHLDDIDQHLEDVDQHFGEIEQNVYSKKNIITTSDGVTEYTFKAGQVYYITNNGSSNVTISHRDTPSGQSSDVITIIPSSKIAYIPASDGIYLRYGAACNITIETWAERIIEKYLSDNLSIEEDLSENIVKNKGVYIGSKQVGDSVGAADISSTGVCDYILVPCKTGEAFFVTGTGGAGTRLWAFLDENRALVSMEGPSTSRASGIWLRPIVDGYLVLNFMRSAPFTAKRYSAINCAEEFGESNSKTYAGIALISSSRNRILDVPISAKKGDTISVTIPHNNLYADGSQCGYLYINGSTILVNAQMKSAEEFTFQAEQDIELVHMWFTTTNMLSGDSVDIVLLVKTNEPIQGKLGKIEMLESGLMKYQFGYIADGDVSNLSTSQSFVKKNTAEIYALYDALVSAYPEYVSRIDCDADVIGHISTTRPAALADYPLYIYKFRPKYTPFGVNHDGAYLADELKVFIVTGTHDEPFSVESAYDLMLKVCQDWASDGNLEDLRFNATFYVMPVGNPWAMSQEGSGGGGNIRVNYDGVDLNRNMPTKDWQLSGAGTNTYSGPSAGSEYESQVLAYYIDTIRPVLFMDFHNFATDYVGNMAYIGSKDTRVFNIGNEVMSRISRILKAENSNYPSDGTVLGWISTQKSNTGLRSTYAREKGVLSCTLEVAAGSCWQNGVKTQSVIEGTSAQRMTENMQIFAYAVIQLLKNLCRV